MRHHGVRLIALSGIAGICILWAFSATSSGFNQKNSIIAGVMIIALGAVALISAILDGRRGNGGGSR